MAYNNEDPKYIKYNIKGWEIKINPGYRQINTVLSAIEHDNYDNVRGPFETIASSKYARVFKCPVGMGGRKVTLYLKYFLNRSLIDIIKHIFRPGRAVRAYTASKMLGEKGFNCPVVIAYGEKHIGPVCVSGVLITEEIRDAYDIYCYLLDNWKVNIQQTLREKRDMIRQLGQTIGEMHKNEIFHGDLRLGNIFARNDHGRWTFYFIDNERTKCFGKLPWRYRVKNLVQCNMLKDNLSKTDRLRFFKEYISRQKIDREKQAVLTREVVSKTSERHKNK